MAGPRLPGPEAGAVAAAGEHEQVGAFCGSGDGCTVLTAAPAYMSLTAVRAGREQEAAPARPAGRWTSRNGP